MVRLEGLASKRKEAGDEGGLAEKMRPRAERRLGFPISWELSWQGWAMGRGSGRASEVSAGE